MGFSVFPKDAVPGSGFSGGVHMPGQDAPTAAAPMSSGLPSAVALLSGILLGVKPQSSAERAAIGFLLGELHAEGNLAQRIDKFLHERRANQRAGYQAEAERLTLECRQVNARCDSLRGDLARAQSNLNETNVQLQKARFAFDTAKDESLPRWPTVEEKTAKERRIEAARAKVEQSSKDASAAGDEYRRLAEVLVQECKKLAAMDHERARADAFSRGEAFENPETHLPELPPV